MKHLIFSKVDNIGIVQMKRIEGKGNALHRELLEELNKCLRNVSADENIFSLILTGTGEYFSSGLDLNSITNFNPDNIKKYFDLSSEVFFNLFSLPIPTVAAINGHAVAGGAVLAISCDYRIIYNNYKFGFTGINLGIPYPLIPLEIMKFAIPSYMISELLLQGKLIDSQTCFKKNIVHSLLSKKEDIIENSIDYISKNFKAPKKNYKFLKQNLQKPVLERIEKFKQKHDNLQFQLFNDDNLQKVLRDLTLKYKK